MLHPERTTDNPSRPDMMQAVALIAIAAFWLCPLILFLNALWRDHTPFSTVGCALGMSVGTVAFFLPAGYYRPRRWEQSGRLYERLGVRSFKRWTPNGDYALRRARRLDPNYRIISSIGGLSGIGKQTCQSEQGHLLMMLVTLPAVLYAAWRGWFALASWLVVGNLIINVYPMMVQRYNRARIHRSLNRPHTN